MKRRLAAIIATIICIVAIMSIVVVTRLRAREAARWAAQEAQLNQLGQGLFAFAAANDGVFLRPGRIDTVGAGPGVGAEDFAQNTTANLYSSGIAMHYFTPSLVVSPLERNPVVKVKQDYDHESFAVVNDTYWDASFAADLSSDANASFAHLPLDGKRGREGWRDTRNSEFILLGSRGPKDGRLDRFSYALGPDGTWRGHVLFADGHTALLDDVVLEGGVLEPSGRIIPDNLFAQEGLDPYAGGYDMFMSFTSRFESGVAVFQWD